MGINFAIIKMFSLFVPKHISILSERAAAVLTFKRSNSQMRLQMILKVSTLVKHFEALLTLIESFELFCFGIAHGVKNMKKFDDIPLYCLSRYSLGSKHSHALRFRFILAVGAHSLH